MYDETQGDPDTPDAGDSPHAAGLRPPARVHRYVVLDRIGAGGMGVVYAAYDPDLDRRVALKLLHPDREASPHGVVRLLREAQALARLSHPNVVAIHDVGEHDGGIFLAMELVDGMTLRAWTSAEPRTPREIVAAIVQAGQGLAAAHAKGLVHRDFKPENVMIGADGRVRVMDFGLAREDLDRQITGGDHSTAVLRQSLTRDGAVLGTPHYMAPEQLRGGEIGAPADQFAFCATAYELLYGERAFTGNSIAALLDEIEAGVERSVPGTRRVAPWLRRVIVRGLAAAPEQRWPTMDALLVALRADPRPRRIAIAVGGAAVAIAVGVVGLDRWQARRVELGCDEVAAALGDRWSPARAEDVRTAMLATGVGHAEASATRTIAALDALGASWKDAAASACRAHDVAHTLDDDDYARARVCLEGVAAEVDELAGLLAVATPEHVHAAVGAAMALSGVAPCTDVEGLRRRPHDADAERAQQQLRAALVSAEARHRVGEFAAARDAATTVRDEAEALGLRPLVARAELQGGAALLELGEFDAARDRLIAAVERAGAAGADEVAAEAAQRLIHLVGVIQGKPDDGLMWARQAQMWLERAGAPIDDPRRALVLTSRALVIEERGQWHEALAVFEEARALLQRTLGDEHALTAQAHHDIGVVHHGLGDTVAARRELELALATKRAVFGEGHPEVATTLAALGEILGAAGLTDDAIAVLRESLAIRESAYGPDHPVVAHSLYTLAHPLGPTDEAETMLKRALAINERAVGPKHADTGMCIAELGVLAFRRGDYATARDRYVEAVAVIEVALGPENPLLSHLRFNLGNAQRRTGQSEAAVDNLDRALAIAEAQLGKEHPFVAEIALEAGRVRAELGRDDEAAVLLQRSLEHPQVADDVRDDAKAALAKLASAAG